MSLPNDISRCAGAHDTGTCDKRDTCRRYTERKPGGGAGEWYIHPQIPGPCAYYLPIDPSICYAHSCYGPCPWCAQGAPDFREEPPPEAANGERNEQ